MLREFRRSDASAYFEILRSDFPEEDALLGMDEGGYQRVVKLVFRWDARILLGLLRLVGRPVFHFYAIEQDRALAAVAILTYTPRAGYVGSVAVAKPFRRRGLARRIMEAARRQTVRRHKPYIALDVLEKNAPARALYESLGYRELRRQAFFARPSALAGPPTASTGVIRPFRRRDGPALAQIANEGLPPNVREVLPFESADFRVPSLIARVLLSETTAWVIDRGTGPKGFLRATAGRITQAAHLTAPLVDASVPEDDARALVQTALAWTAERNPARLVAEVPEHNTRGAALLKQVGFTEALPMLTLFRPSE